MAKDQTVVDEIKVSIDFELFETANVENNPLLFMVENKRGTLLSHPVTKAYMYRKWVENTAYFYSFTFVLYFLAALSHTMFMVRVRRKLDGYSAETANTNHIGNRWFAITCKFCKLVRFAHPQSLHGISWQYQMQIFSVNSSHQSNRNFNPSRMRKHLIG